MSDPENDDLVTEVISGPIATLTLNRPRARNALSTEMRAVLERRVLALTGSPEIRVVLVAAAGTAFCAGGDIREMSSRLQADPGTVGLTGWRRQLTTHRFLTSLHSIDKVTIAAVNGPAMGLGFDLALACDFIVASPEALFSMSYVRRGLIPDGGGLYFLPRRVGLAKAKELIFSGRDIDVQEASRLGIVDVLATGDLLAEATSFAGQFVDSSPAAIGMAKSIIDRTFESSIEEVFALGSTALSVCYTTQAHRDAVTAFLNGSGRSKPVVQT